MSTPTPPTLSNGHQPVEGEGIREIRVRSARGQDYQSEASELVYEFPVPVTVSEALPVEAEMRQLAGELAQAKLDAVIAGKNAANQAAVEAAQAAIAAPSEPEGQPPFQPQGFKRPPQVQQPQASPEQVVTQEFPQAQQVPSPAPAGEPQWQWAEKANGKGSVRFLPESVISKRDLEMGAKKVIEQEHGIPESEVIVFDNRDRLREGRGYSAGSVKPRNDSFVQQVIGDQYLGDVEWHDDGTIKVYLNKHGQKAVTAVKAAQVGQPAPAATPL